MYQNSLDLVSLLSLMGVKAQILILCINGLVMCTITRWFWHLCCLHSSIGKSSPLTCILHLGSFTAVALLSWVTRWKVSWINPLWYSVVYPSVAFVFMDFVYVQNVIKRQKSTLLTKANSTIKQVQWRFSWSKFAVIMNLSPDCLCMLIQFWGGLDCSFSYCSVEGLQDLNYVFLICYC